MGTLALSRAICTEYSRTMYRLAWASAALASASWALRSAPPFPPESDGHCPQPLAPWRPPDCAPASHRRRSMWRPSSRRRAGWRPRPTTRPRSGSACTTGRTARPGHPPGQDRLVGQEPPQVGREVGRRRVPVVRVLLDRLVDDRSQVPRDGPVQRPQPGRVGGRHLLDQLLAHPLVERRPEGEQLVQSQPKGVDVAAGVALPLERLRGHVPQGAEHVPGVGQVFLVVRLGQPEVAHPDAPCRSSSRFDGLMSRCRMPCL